MLIKKRLSKKPEQKRKTPERITPTIFTDQDEILEQQHDTPPSLYQDHQQ